jgi:uncharacterized protein (TIGR03437 family)
VKVILKAVVDNRSEPGGSDNAIVYIALLSRRSFLILGLSTLLLAGPICAQSLFPKPVKVLGDPNFLGTAANPLAIDTQAANVVEGREMRSPEGIALDNSVSPPIVYIADTANNRVLAYKYSTQLTAGAFADLILGQLDRFSTIGAAQGVTTALKAPTGLTVDSSGNLYVADTGNNRVVRYPKPFTQTGYQIPDLIIGQTSFSGTGANTGGIKASTLNLSPNGSFAGRTGLALDSSGNLWVADIGNNRVLRFPVGVLQTHTTAPSADLAAGQKDLVSSTAATSRISTSTMAAPTGIAFDPVGNLLVADGLARVLVYPPGIGLNASAIRLLGLDTSQTTNAASAIAIGGSSGTVEGVAVAGANILVADNNNNRVLVFGAVSTWPAQSVQFSPTANQVLGQTTFTAATANGGNPVPGASVLASPTDMAASSTEVFVADTANNRVLVFPISGGTISQTASRVIGQLDFPYNAPNLVEGKEFSTVNGTAFGGSAVLDLSATPPHLYVADSSNNRILGFANFNSAQSGQRADIVIGQPNFLHVVVNYPSGQASQPTAQSLNTPFGLTVDSSGNLYVADTGNSRILRFPAPFASGVTANESADLVIGQSNFTSVVTDATARTMAAPISLAFTSTGGNTALPNSGYLVAADVSQNRVLLFPKPFSSGMVASIVLGQANFVSQGNGTTTSAFTSPGGVAVDPQDRILVADSGNARVQVFPPVGSLASSGTPASFAISTGLTQPVSIGMSSTGDFWVADSSSTTNRLLHFASIDNLPLANPPFSAEATVPAISPRSAFVDFSGNLLVTDGIDRVLYFVPQANALNAANSIVGRALAAGTIVSLYAAQTTNVISSGTVIASTLPLPTNLSDTEVLVNGVPSALFYVSPGQINFPLSYSLPQAGVANVQVIRPSTGQIYAAAEIPLASASPGLFVEGAQQSGPVAALNQDNTVNTATNPATRGSVIQVFATGQGPVAGAPADGQASTGQVPTSVLPQIILGSSGNGIEVPAANITYSGLAPQNVGLWQINFTIPSNAPTGTSVPITVYMNSISSSNSANPTQVVTTLSLK